MLRQGWEREITMNVKWMVLLCSAILFAFSGCIHSENARIIGLWRNTAKNNDYCELMFAPDKSVYYTYRSENYEGKITTLRRTGRYDITNHTISIAFPEGIPDLLSGGIAARQIVDECQVDDDSLTIGKDHFAKVKGLQVGQP